MIIPRATNQMPPTMDSDSILLEIVKWLWLAVVGAIIHIYRKLVSLDTQSKLLDQAQNFYVAQRAEDRELRKEDLLLREKQREELSAKITRHHTVVMERLEGMGSTDKD